MSQEFLFVLWAGGGNVPPQLTLARRLVARGHQVRMLTPAVLRESIEAAGIAFEPYREIPEHDVSVPERSLVRDFEARSKAAALAAARDNLVAAMARPVAPMSSPRSSVVPPTLLRSISSCSGRCSPRRRPRFRRQC